MKPTIDRHGTPPTVTCTRGKVGYLQPPRRQAHRPPARPPAG